MYNKVLKQILWAGAFLALAFFVIDIFKLYLEFTPDRFKLSISSISFDLSVLLLKNLLMSLIVILPILFLSLSLSVFKNYRIVNKNIQLNRGLFFLLSFITINFYAASVLMANIKVRTILTDGDLKLIEPSSFIFSLVFILVVFVLFVFRRFKSRRIWELQKRSLLSTIIALSLIVFVFFEFNNLHFLNERIVNFRSLYNQLFERDIRDTKQKDLDYKDEFRKYLDLEDIYENEKNYLKLLKRRTSFKAKEHSVVFIYVDSLSKDELVSNVKFQLFSFVNAFENFSDSKKSLRYMKINLPPVINIEDLVDDKLIKSNYLNVFKDYITSTKEELSELPKGLHFSIFHLKTLSSAEYLLLNKMIKENGDDTVFVVTTKSSTIKPFSITEDNYLGRSTFISFHIPKSLGSVDYKENKVIGQEDIMTTLYNLALSEREYLSLGDDIFIDSNSNAINEAFCVDSSGLYIKGEVHSKVKNNKLDMTSLTQRCESTRNIAEFIIKQSWVKD